MESTPAIRRHAEVSQVIPKVRLPRKNPCQRRLYRWARSWRMAWALKRADLREDLVGMVVDCNMSEVKISLPR